MIYLYRLYQLFVMLPLMLCVTFITAIVTAFGSICFGGKWWGYYPPMLWSRIMLALTLVTIKVVGSENISGKQSYVFVANHQGAYDIFAIYGYLGHNFKWMMKKSLEKIPLVGWACRRAGQIFVDNKTPRGIKETMAMAEAQLAHGMSLVVFPEGARTFTGKLGRFKRGAYTLAQEFNLPVVPVTIDGAFDIMPRTSRIPHYGHITMTIHPAIESSADDLIDRSRQSIASVLPPDLI